MADANLCSNCIWVLFFGNYWISSSNFQWLCRSLWIFKTGDKWCKTGLVKKRIQVWLKISAERNKKFLHLARNLLRFQLLETLTIWNMLNYFPLLTLYTLASICIYSILPPTHFLCYWQGEFVQQSTASFVGDHFCYSHDCYVWFRCDIVRRN